MAILSGHERYVAVHESASSDLARGRSVCRICEHSHPSPLLPAL